jgi:hypothetical protein
VAVISGQRSSVQRRSTQRWRLQAGHPRRLMPPTQFRQRRRALRWLQIHPAPYATFACDNGHSRPR